MNNYVLIFVDSENRPQYLQGTIAAINAELKKLWENGDIDREDWDYYQNCWQLLAIEDDRLTTVNRYECRSVPQFSVY